MTDERSNRDSARPDDEERPLGSADPEGEQGEQGLDSALDSEEARLYVLASRIDQGRPIDWEAAARDAHDDRERAIIAEMRLLADVARVGREQAQAFEPAAGRPGAQCVRYPSEKFSGQET